MPKATESGFRVKLEAFIPFDPNDPSSVAKAAELANKMKDGKALGEQTGGAVELVSASAVTTKREKPAT